MPMKVSDMIRNAWKAYTRAAGETVRFLLVEGCLTLICLAPLLFLNSGALAPCAWAVIPLWILIMLPARMNAALAMRNALAGGKLGNRQLVETEGYARKLSCGLKRAAFLLLWGAPLIFMAIVFRIHFSGDVDSFTVLKQIMQLGGGDLMTGILYLLLMLAGAVIVFLIGLAFHSGARHGFAQGDVSLVRGHHGRIMGAWLIALLSILPMLIAVAAVILRYLPAIQDLNGLMRKTVQLPDTKGTLLILGAGALLTLPLLPLRSLISAACVEGLKD